VRRAGGDERGRVEVIGILIAGGFVAGVRTVVAMSVSIVT
jgi:hypothetical protein